MHQRGFHLLEALVASAVLLSAALIAGPSLLSATSALRLHLAAMEVSTVLRQARSAAIRYDQRVAVRFHTEAEPYAFQLYRDDDGDGVRNEDIRRGVDRPISPARPLSHVGARVRFGFPPGLRPRDPSNPGRRLGRLEDPVRFNRSDLASFSPLGQSTPGSVYLTDGGSGLAAVRLYGRTGKILVLTYDAASETWR